MSDISVVKLNYIEGMAETYAETVARVGKPLASVEIYFDDEPGNWEIIKNLEKSLKEKADGYGIKFYSHDYRQELKDSKNGPIYTKPGKDFCYYRNEKVLKEYLSVINKKERSNRDHRQLGKIFGYSEDKIEEFLKRKNKA